MSLVNGKVELKLRWTKHCVLSVLGVANADNADGANSNNTSFTIKHKIICSCHHCIRK